MTTGVHAPDWSQLVAFAPFCMAILHTDTGDGPGVLDLADAGLSAEPSLIPKVRVLLGRPPTTMR